MYHGSSYLFRNDPQKVHGESYGIFTSPSPSGDISPHVTLELCPSVATQFFHWNPQNLLSKFLPPWETILDRQLGSSACYLLGHPYMFKLSNLID